MKIASTNKTLLASYLSLMQVIFNVKAAIPQCLCSGPSSEHFSEFNLQTSSPTNEDRCKCDLRVTYYRLSAVFTVDDVWQWMDGPCSDPYVSAVTRL